TVLPTAGTVLAGGRLVGRRRPASVRANRQMADAHTAPGEPNPPPPHHGHTRQRRLDFPCSHQLRAQSRQLSPSQALGSTHSGSDDDQPGKGTFLHVNRTRQLGVRVRESWSVGGGGG